MLPHRAPRAMKPGHHSRGALFGLAVLLFAPQQAALDLTTLSAAGLSLTRAIRVRVSAHERRGVLQSPLRDVVAAPPGLLHVDEELRVAAEDNRARRSTPIRTFNLYLKFVLFVAVSVFAALPGSYGSAGCGPDLTLSSTACPAGRPGPGPVR